MVAIFLAVSNDVIDVFLMSLLSTLHIFHTYF